MYFCSQIICQILQQVHLTGPKQTMQLHFCDQTQYYNNNNSNVDLTQEREKICKKQKKKKERAKVRHTEYIHCIHEEERKAKESKRHQ